jgi:hypothetical protein
MRTITTAEAALLATGAYAIRYRLNIRDQAGAWVDYTTWMVDAKWDQDIDNPVAGLSVGLAFIDNPINISPLIGSALPIDLGRGIKLEVAYATNANTAPMVWHNVFVGSIDYIDTSDYNTLQIEARDLGGALMDAFIEVETEYGTDAGTPLEVVMQTILTAWAPTTVNLYTPVSPGALVGKYKQSKRPVLEALRELALQIGWTIGYKWDENTSAWRLTLADPGRTISTPMYTLTGDMYFAISQCALDRSSVRNFIKGVCGPAASRITQTVSDATSINRYGRRYMELVEADDSVINTLPELQRYLGAALADLKDPKVALEAELHLFPWVELNDYYEFAPNGTHFDTPQRAAVISVRHSIGINTYRSTFALRGQPAGAYNRWLAGDGGRPGGPPPNDTDAPSAPGGFTSTFTGPDALFGWNAVTGAAHYIVEVYSNGVLRRTVNVAAEPQPKYIYDFESNRTDAGAPQSTVQILVRAATATGLTSTAGSQTATNLPPSAPTALILVGEPLRYSASIAEPAVADLLRIEWESDDNSAFTTPTQAASGLDWRGVQIGLESGTNATYVRVRLIDAFNQASSWTVANANGVLVGAGNIAAGSISIAKFAQGVRPVSIGQVLPSAPYTGYVEGDLFMLMSGGAGGPTACVMSETLKGPSVVLDNTKRIVQWSSSVSQDRALATESHQGSGKWYFEVTVEIAGDPGGPIIGLASTAGVLSTLVGGDANSYSYYGYHPTGTNGTKFNNFWATNQRPGYGTTYNDEDTVGVGLDLDAGKLSFWKNGIALGVAFTGLTGEFWPAVSADAAQVTYLHKLKMNFGNEAFENLPNGYSAWGTPSPAQAEALYRLTDPSAAGASGWTAAIGENDLQDNAVTASKILAGSIIAGKIAAGAVGATEIAARAITATQLAVGDFSNLITNDASFSGNISDWAGVVVVANTGGGGRPYAIYQDDRDGYFRGPQLANMMPCEPGRQYWVEAVVRTPSSTYPFTVGLHFNNSAGSNPQWIGAAQANPTSAFTTISGMVTAPAGAAYMAFWSLISKPAGSDLGNPWYYAKPVVRRAASGELIVDGAVTASKITALDLSAVQGTFGGGPNKSAIDSRGLRVYDSASINRVAAGELAGLPFGGGNIPAGAYGFYGRKASLYLEGHPKIIAQFPVFCDLTFSGGSTSSFGSSTAPWVELPINWVPSVVEASYIYPIVGNTVFGLDADVPITILNYRVEAEYRRMEDNMWSNIYSAVPINAVRLRVYARYMRVAAFGGSTIAGQQLDVLLVEGS